MHQPTVAAGLVSGLIAYASRKGADAGALVERAGLPSAMLVDPDRRVAFESYISLMRYAQAMTGNPALALHFGADTAMAELSIVGLIMEASPTMGDALRQMQRYGRLALALDGGGGSPRFGLDHADGKLFLVDRRRDPDTFPEVTEEGFARLVCGPRRFLTAPHVLSVHFTHAAPPYRTEYERIFRCPVQFGARWNAMELHPEVASWRVALYPRYVFGVLCEKAEALLADHATPRNHREQVEAALRAVLHQGDVSADEIARRLDCSRSTLFRRLQEEGTSYSEVLGKLRRDLAIQYLRGRKVSVDEVAYLVGFSDAAAFSRAFKRWTGEAPGRYRAQWIPG